MSAPLADDVQTSLGAGSRCKGTIKFADLQILSEKSFKSFNGNRVVLVDRTTQCNLLFRV